MLQSTNHDNLYGIALRYKNSNVEVYLYYDIEWPLLNLIVPPPSSPQFFAHKFPEVFILSQHQDVSTYWSFGYYTPDGEYMPVF